MVMKLQPCWMTSKRRPPEATKGARSVLDDIDVGIWNFMNVFFLVVFLIILVLAMY